MTKSDLLGIYRTSLNHIQLIMAVETAFRVRFKPTEVAAFHTVRTALESKGITTAEAEIAWIPKQTVRVEGGDARTLIKLIESLEELDDVQKVDANFDIDMSELAADD